MSTLEVSRKPTKPLTMADMIAAITVDQTLPLRKRQDVCSSLRTIAKALKRAPEHVPAHAGSLRIALKDIAPAMVGLTTERFANIQSLSRFAFAHLGINGARQKEPLSSAWANGLSAMPTKALRVGLMSMGRYCTAQQIEPEEVTQSTFDSFKDYLDQTRLSRDPRETHRMACKLWNEAGVKVCMWPKTKIAVPSYRNSYVVPWTTFPVSLKMEVDAYLDHLAGKDRFAKRDFKPLRPSSVSTKSWHLHEFCSALVRAGRDPSTLKSLVDLVTEDAIRSGLGWLLDVRKAERQAHGVGITLLILAKHHVKLPEAEIEWLQGVCKELDKTPRGMTAKNKERMRQFDDPRVLNDLLMAPRTLCAEAKKIEAPCKRALRVQTALAMELLLNVPIRLQNLSHLELGKHIIRMRKCVVRLVIEGKETKNGQPYDAILMPELSRLIEEYVDHQLPVLQRGKPSVWMFPGYKGAKTHPPFRKQIMSAVKRLAGATLNPHSFRHLAAKLILDEEPGAYGKVRLVLGHTSTATTQRAYAGNENAAALRHYDRTILERRARAQASSSNTGIRRA